VNRTVQPMLWRDGYAFTQKWVPLCPFCQRRGVRTVAARPYLEMLAMDCQCLACGWFYSSRFKRTVLAVCARMPLPSDAVQEEEP